MLPGHAGDTSARHTLLRRPGINIARGHGGLRHEGGIIPICGTQGCGRIAEWLGGAALAHPPGALVGPRGAAVQGCRMLGLGCILTVFCVTGMRTTTRRRHQARQNWLSSGRPQGPGAGTKGRLPAGLCPQWVSPSSLLPPRCHGRRESELCDLRGSGEKRSFLPFIPGLRAANPPFGAWNDFIIKPARSPSLFIYFFHPPNTWAMLGG